MRSPSPTSSFTAEAWIKPIPTEEPKGPNIGKNLNIQPTAPDKKNEAPKSTEPKKDQPPPRTPKPEELQFEKPDAPKTPPPATPKPVDAK